MEVKDWTKAKFKKEFDQDQRSKILCNINAFRTPKILGIGRKLTKDEVFLMWKQLAPTLTRKVWLETWNDRSWESLETEQ